MSSSTVLAATGMLHGQRVRKAGGELTTPLLTAEEAEWAAEDGAAVAHLPDFGEYEGLEEREAGRRLAYFGPNRIAVDRPSLARRIVVTVTRPMPVFLVGVGILCGVIQDWVARCQSLDEVRLMVAHGWSMLSMLSKRAPTAQVLCLLRADPHV